MDDPALDVPLALRDLIGSEVLSDFLRTFHDMFGVGVRIDGPDGATFSEACEQEEICGFVNTTPGGRAACVATVRTTRERSLSRGAPGAVPCFTAGRYRLGEVQYDGHVLGRVVIGPYLAPDRTGAPQTLFEADPRIDTVRALPLLLRMPRLKEASAERLVDHLLHILEGLLFAGHRALLASQMQIASSRESYRELSEKSRQLTAAFERLQELDRLKSNFLATVSHELRTPLTSILGYTEMLREGLAGALNSEQKEYVSTIHTKGEQLLGLITGILDLAKIDSASVSIDRSWVDVRALCHDVARSFEPHARKGDLSIAVAVPRDLPRLWTDLERLRQILVNLVDNAVKFTPPGGAMTIGARIEASPSDDDIGLVLTAPVQSRIVLSVADTGIGIAQDCADRIFDAFYQVDSSSTRRFGGAGLGLSIVRRLVELLGGRITVQSQPGEGSVFEASLPLEEPEGESRA